MHNFRPELLLCAALAAFSVAASAGSEPTPEPSGVHMLTESNLFLEGDSTVRKFSSQATKIDLKIEPDTRAQDAGVVQKLAVQKFILTVPIKALKSDSSTLDEHLQEALKAEQYPDIQAQIKTYQIKDRAPDGAYPATASVEFKIAGSTQVLPVEARIVIDGTRAHVLGKKRILMTDFKIEPPTLMLGVIRTANEIDVTFDLIFGMKGTP